MSDSPWFWVLMFSGMALAALVAIGPKYGGRQAGLELKYQARERIEAERAANRRGEDERIEEWGPEEPRALATPEETLIPLWPLAVLLMVVVILSAGMLVRGGALSRKRRGFTAEGEF